MAAYAIEFAELVKGHLEALTARQRTTVLDALEPRLANEPLSETRNRKPLRPNPIAPWELRVGNLRVFYEVATTPAAVVRILAVGIKERNIVRIGGQEFQL
ncbi:MAG: type II toxin-antitoxin system RelE/ParE family toxin [Acidobacteria bacterium]|nr:type II toxin-antitoxin system RelE/ParE family toxin [Acidobacteriota bacterium]